MRTPTPAESREVLHILADIGVDESIRLLAILGYRLVIVANEQPSKGKHHGAKR